jgi:hypothetical protein
VFGHPVPLLAADCKKGAAEEPVTAKTRGHAP